MPSLWQLFVSIGADNSDFKRGMQESESIAEKFGNTFDALDKKLGAAIGFGAISAGALAAANKFESASIDIQRATGATGDKLEELEKSFTNVYTSTAKSADQVSSALSLLSTRTQATGKDLENLTLSALKLSSVHKEDVSTIIPAVTQMFATWNIATNKQAAALDYLRVVSQQTGTPVARLTEEVVSQAPMLKNLGYNWEQATALIGNFDKTGALAQGGLNALKKVLATFAKEGVTDTTTAWRQLVAGIEDGSVTLDKFLKIAGARGGVPLFDAIKNHVVDVDNLTKSYDNLAQQGTATARTLHEKFTIWQHDLEALVSSHKDLLVAMGASLPMATAIGSAFKAMAAAAIPPIANIAFALSNGLVGALGAVESALLASGILALLAGIGYGGYKLGDALQQKFAPGGNTTPYQPGKQWQVVGHDVVPATAAPKIGQSILDYVGGLSPSAPKAHPGPLPLSPEDASKDFAALHLQDLQAELDSATKAFNELTAAGKLNAGQIKEATDYIEGLRVKIQALRAGLTYERTSSAELLKTLGIPAPADLEPVRNAFVGLLERFNEFVGPKSAEQQRTMVDAWIAYGHALNQAEMAERAREVPLYDAIEAQNKENAALQENIDQLNSMPAAHKAVFDAALTAIGTIQALADAYHAFNMKAPWEQQQAVDEERRQYEILRDSGTATATALDRAYATYKLHQIELDHELGITDNDLYAQQKKNAEDTLKQIDGDVKQSTERRTKYERTCAEDLKRDMESAFDGLEKGLAQNIVEWKGWSDTVKNFGKTVAEDMLASFMKGLFKPLEDELTKLGAKLGSVFDSIWGTGSSAASGAGSAAGSAGSAGGAAAGIGGSALSTGLGIAQLGVSVLSGIVSGFQQAHMESDLQKIEESTRRMDIATEQNGDYNILRNTGFIRDNTAFLLKKYDDWLIPWFKDMRDALVSMAGGKGAGTVNNVTINTYNLSDLVTELKTLGVIPA